ncbi:MAG: hypothetical protein ACREHG_00580, partial [Candidatus Saccharimonadales bacterium]
MAIKYSKSLWLQRLAIADKYYTAWKNRFKCDTLDRYYEGFQWADKIGTTAAGYEPYTLNLINSTIHIKLASLLFQKPSFNLSPTPGTVTWNMDAAMIATELKQNVLNTLIANPNMNFAKHLKRAAKDSFFRFGIIECGYSSDWRNPQKEAPYLRSDTDPTITETRDRVIDDNDVPVNERFYIRRIKPQRFRVSISDSEDLQDHEWFGYYEYFYTRALINTKGINWTDPDLGSLSQFSADFTGFVGTSPEIDINPELANELRRCEITKCWRLWDQVTHTELLVRHSDGAVLWQTSYDKAHLIDIRWDERADGFYPIPPVFQWLSPQNEINEAREQTRNFRRRFTRKFQYVEDTVDVDEVEKFASGPDGILIKVKVQNAISPIENPQQGPTAENALLLAKDDFNIVSGTSAEARGQADRETATQAKITDIRAQIRENAEQIDFSNFVCLVGRDLLVLSQE